jgi:hypothetical protein
MKAVVHQVGAAMLTFNVVSFNVENAVFNQPLCSDAEFAPDDGAVETRWLKTVVGYGIDNKSDDFRRTSAICTTIDELLNPWL